MPATSTIETLPKHSLYISIIPKGNTISLEIELTDLKNVYYDFIGIAYKAHHLKDPRLNHCLRRRTGPNLSALTL